MSTEMKWDRKRAWALVYIPLRATVLDPSGTVTDSVSTLQFRIGQSPVLFCSAGFTSSTACECSSDSALS
jgi:hypothetical protein